MKTKSILLLFILPGFIACSSPQVKKTPEESIDTRVVEKAKDSSVDIHYILGREHYRFFVEAKGAQVIANTYLGKQVVEQGMIDSNRYPEFLSKASSFIDHQPKTPNPELNCRTPFKVTVRIGQDTQSVRGCRTSDGGALSKLVRDGEFLLYSKN